MIKILELYINHTFYKNYEFNNYSINFSSESHQLMMKYGIEASIKRNNIIFYSTNESIKETIQFAAEQLNYLELEIHSEDPYIFQYTDTPINWIGQFEYSNHNSSNQLKEKRIILHQKLSDIHSSSSFCKIKLLFEDIAKQIELGNSYPVIYEINLKARLTQWQYYVISGDPISLDNMVIRSESDILFNEPIEVIIRNGQKALLFSSKGLIALSELPIYKFSLVNKLDQHNDDLIISELPIPSVESMETVLMNGEKQVSSPMYIYV